ncbi:unnamed protein product [Cercopithifilaria johnstoni]|uniref:Uncharacterized protein n=1 Tax=Cercopithifilaria johnstoni TaxID=2874296 RepID=A0A8J2Q6W8_9BILA|nr:unnamed protein product [Cercopithifilaria johnstoni]
MAGISDDGREKKRGKLHFNGFDTRKCLVGDRSNGGGGDDGDGDGDGDNDDAGNGCCGCGVVVVVVVVVVAVVAVMVVVVMVVVVVGIVSSDDGGRAVCSSTPMKCQHNNSALKRLLLDPQLITQIFKPYRYIHI